MLIISLVIAAIILWILLKPKKKEEVCDNCEPDEEELCEEIELKKLAVIYQGKYLTSQEIVKIPYNTSVTFTVEGFDITGTKEVCIQGNQIMWLKSCPSVHWINNDGRINSVYISNKTKNIAREVWVKYSNGITFSWKVEVV